ncbi:MAG: HIRAN domain-containing protein [Gammaproteobacteria bacterium]|nr:HIRAN domain-containing protein [Gammaproteobacteria bacterium]
MNRRATFRVISGLPLLLPGLVLGARAASGEPPLLLQISPLAGFQFHSGAAVWDRLRVGDPLRLVRESDNPHDGRAVAVYWQNRKLGYVPRLDNAAVSQLLDRRRRLSARVEKLNVSLNPWERIGFSVSLG